MIKKLLSVLMFLKEVECHKKKEDYMKVKGNALPGLQDRETTPSKNLVSTMPQRAKSLEKFQESITKYKGFPPKSERSSLIKDNNQDLSHDAHLVASPILNYYPVDLPQSQ